MCQPRIPGADIDGIGIATEPASSNSHLLKLQLETAQEDNARLQVGAANACRMPSSPSQTTVVDSEDHSRLDSKDHFHLARNKKHFSMEGQINVLFFRSSYPKVNVFVD